MLKNIIKCLVRTIKINLIQIIVFKFRVQLGTANLISGVTIHSFLKISDVINGKNVQKICEDLKILLVDELSYIINRLYNTRLDGVDVSIRCK